MPAGMQDTFIYHNDGLHLFNTFECFDYERTL